MKAIFLILALLGAGSTFAQTSRGTLPPKAGVCIELDMSSTNLTTAFLAIHTSLTGRSGFLIKNPSAQDMWGNATSLATNCAAGADQFLVPAGGYILLSRGEIQIGNKVCLRAADSTLSTGKLRSCVW